MRTTVTTVLVETFAGVWSVDRAVVDARARLEGHLRGTAQFEPAGDDRLAYVERGVLTFGGVDTPAGRRLLLQGVGGPSVEVLFGDGRPFYRFDLLDGRWSGEHACGDDTYTVTGRLLDTDRFEEVWCAVGPRKDYRLTTMFRRTGPGS